MCQADLISQSNGYNIDACKKSSITWLSFSTKYFYENPSFLAPKLNAQRE